MTLPCDAPEHPRPEQTAADGGPPDGQAPSGRDHRTFPRWTREAWPGGRHLPARAGTAGALGLLLLLGGCAGPPRWPAPASQAEQQRLSEQQRLAEQQRQELRRLGEQQRRLEQRMRRMGERQQRLDRQARRLGGLQRALEGERRFLREERGLLREERGLLEEERRQRPNW